MAEANMNRLPIIVTIVTAVAPLLAADACRADDLPTQPRLLARADDPMADGEEEHADDRADDQRRERLERLREWRERRGDDRAGRPGAPARDRELSDEDRRNALAVMRDVNPEMAERFDRALAGDNPERARRVLDRMSGRLLELHRLKREQPEAYRLRVADHRAKIDTFKLARQLRAARMDRDAERVEHLTAELREQLESHFEIRQKLRERELAELEQRLERMREELQEHRAKKAALIDQSLERIVEGRRPDDRRGGHGKPDRDDQLDLD